MHCPFGVVQLKASVALQGRPIVSVTHDLSPNLGPSTAKTLAINSGQEKRLQGRGGRGGMDSVRLTRVR